ncbi:MAG TPA: carbohydrate ABC transporter permease [Clostridiales bacterium]|nr:carbohydrate ABC transporter permease [Clostridiales bacterium]
MTKRNKSNIIIHILLCLYTVVTLAPLVIVLSSSFRSIGNMTSHIKLFSEFKLDSYIAAFTRMNFPVVFMNSVLTTFGSVIVVVLIASMAAYPIARIKNKRSRFLYYFFIAGLVIPSQMVIIPIAQMFNNLGISYNRFTPMIMFITCSLPFSTFLFTGFMGSVPISIEEAAYIDGSSLFRRYFGIVFPLLKPATVSVIITQGIWIWNDYFFPMVFVSRSSQFSLPVAMIQFLGDRENPAQWNVLFASCILCALPLVVLFLVFQKQFVNGVAAGAVKG